MACNFVNLVSISNSRIHSSPEQI
uniref:Uncharacterized protein n=1 Tax=Arundo donax TaxID=35708 RepID=A0A0A9A478_ARUDO